MPVGGECMHNTNLLSFVPLQAGVGVGGACVHIMGLVQPKLSHLDEGTLLPEGTSLSKEDGESIIGLMRMIKLKKGKGISKKQFRQLVTEVDRICPHDLLQEESYIDLVFSILDINGRGHISPYSVFVTCHLLTGGVSGEVRAEWLFNHLQSGSSANQVSRKDLGRWLDKTFVLFGRVATTSLRAKIQTETITDDEDAGAEASKGADATSEEGADADAEDAGDMALVRRESASTDPQHLDEPDGVKDSVESLAGSEFACGDSSKAESSTSKLAPSASPPVRTSGEGYHPSAEPAISAQRSGSALGRLGIPYKSGSAPNTPVTKRPAKRRNASTKSMSPIPTIRVEEAEESQSVKEQLEMFKTPAGLALGQLLLQMAKTPNLVKDPLLDNLWRKAELESSEVVIPKHKFVDVLAANSHNFKYMLLDPTRMNHAAISEWLRDMNEVQKQHGESAVDAMKTIPPKGERDSPEIPEEWQDKQRKRRGSLRRVISLRRANRKRSNSNVSILPERWARKVSSEGSLEPPLPASGEGKSRSEVEENEHGEAKVSPLIPEMSATSSSVKIPEEDCKLVNRKECGEGLGCDNPDPSHFVAFAHSPPIECAEQKPGAHDHRLGPLIPPKPTATLEPTEFFECAEETGKGEEEAKEEMEKTTAAGTESKWQSGGGEKGAEVSEPQHKPAVPPKPTWS